ncbi:MAG: histidinol dehydrogenase [Dehalococcoidales bacterium]
MRLIQGFKAAKLALSRPVAGAYSVSPALKKRLKQMFATEDPELAVKQIVDEVRRRGDAALFDFTLKIDQVQLESLEVTREQVSRAYQQVDPGLVQALKLAAERILSFHTIQRDGILGAVARMGKATMVRALERVGVYAPGGTACYPSTVLMTAIPARVAGVKQVILVTPPGPEGAVPAPTLVAADIARVDRIFCVGGAQAIAALAFGTESILRVDKICGPGNIFVMLAKKLVYGAVDIDGLQGPSEVVVIADETADPAYCAAELLAQAEHDAMASSILITTSQRLADEVGREVELQLASLERQAIATESLTNSGLIVVVDNIDEAMELSNLYAPEHLCLYIEGADSYRDRVTNAGCVFVGDSATVALGDYVAGPSHALPTGGTARFSSSLNITDFIKYINVVSVDEDSLKELGPAAATIARAEGFEAHARAVEKRLK